MLPSYGMGKDKMNKKLKDLALTLNYLKEIAIELESNLKLVERQLNDYLDKEEKRKYDK